MLGTGGAYLSTPGRYVFGFKNVFSFFSLVVPAPNRGNWNIAIPEKITCFWVLIDDIQYINIPKFPDFSVVSRVATALTREQTDTVWTFRQKLKKLDARLQTTVASGFSLLNFDGKLMILWPGI